MEIKIGTPESLERFANSPVKLTAPGSGQPLVQRLLDQGMGEGVALDSFPENVSGYRLIEEVQERVLVAPCDCRHLRQGEVAAEYGRVGEHPIRLFSQAGQPSDYHLAHGLRDRPFPHSGLGVGEVVALLP